MATVRKRGASPETETDGVKDMDSMLGIEDELAEAEAAYMAERGNRPGSVPGADPDYVYFWVPADTHDHEIPDRGWQAKMLTRKWERDPDGLIMTGFSGGFLYRQKRKTREYRVYLEARDAYKRGLSPHITKHVSPPDHLDEAAQWLDKIKSM